MWTQKTILLNDSFSYTRYGTPWLNAFWISEIVFYLLYHVGGYFAIAAFVSLTGAITFHHIYKQLPGNIFVNSMVVILGAMTAAPIWGPRPQIISFMLIATLDGWVTKANSFKTKGWILVPLFALWSNLHGGWIWGFLLLAAHIAGMITELLPMKSSEQKSLLLKDILSLCLWFVLAAFAVCLNPNGLKIWELPFQQINVSMNIQEWLSPDFHRIDFHPMLWMIFLIIILFPLTKNPPSWSRLYKVIGFLYLTFIAQRNIALFAIVAVPLLSEMANGGFHRPELIKFASRPPDLNPKLTFLFNTLIVILLIAMATGYIFVVTRSPRIDNNYPVAAVEWLKVHNPQGRLFNTYNWGGYLLWNLPEYPVFIDGRADMYGKDILSQWHGVVNDRVDAIQILDKWDINIILLEPGWPIIKSLKIKGWKTVHQDDMSIIMLRPTVTINQ